MVLHGLKTCERKLWSASVSCWWAVAQKRAEESWMFHRYQQEQQKRTRLLLAVEEVTVAELAQGGSAPALAAEMGSCLTAQGMVTFATSPWSTWARPRGRWGNMDGCLISFPHLQEQAQGRLVPGFSVWHPSGCFIGNIWFWATRGLLCLMDRDQMMGWWLQGLSDYVKEHHQPSQFSLSLNNTRKLFWLSTFTFNLIFKHLVNTVVGLLINFGIL